MKNKKAAKISTISDSLGSPLCIHLSKSEHDMKLFEPVFKKFLENKVIRDNRKRITLLVDKGYDSKNIRNIINHNKIKHIIMPINRNVKNNSKKRCLTKKQS